VTTESRSSPPLIDVLERRLDRGDSDQLLIPRSDLRSLIEIVKAAEIGARETVMALDGLESTWSYGGYNGYGKGVSGWDGPVLLKRFLAALKGKQ
jgi:hypothetical protein